MPSGAYPAQLLDLAAGYAYLLSQGFLPENITLLGDSSGGHLVLALSRYLAELAAAVPELNVGMPGAMMLLSVREPRLTDTVVHVGTELRFPAFRSPVATSRTNPIPCLRQTSSARI